MLRLACGINLQNGQGKTVANGKYFKQNYTVENPAKMYLTFNP